MNIHIFTYKFDGETNTILADELLLFHLKYSSPHFIISWTESPHLS